MYIRIGVLLAVLAALAFRFTANPGEMTPSAQAQAVPTATATVPPVATPTQSLPTATVAAPTATVDLSTPTAPAFTPTAEVSPTPTAAAVTDTPTPIPTATPAPTSTATLAPDLTVSLDGSPDVIPDGGIVTYFSTVTNVGTAASAATALLDQLPQGTVIEAIGPGCNPDPAGILCAVPPLQPGQDVSFTFTISAQGGPGTIVNSVLVDPGNQIAEANESNNVAIAATTVAPVAGPPPPPLGIQPPLPPEAVPVPVPQPPAAEVPVPEAPAASAPPPAASAPPLDVAGVQVVPPEAQTGELWLQILAPTQTYSVDMDPLWVAMPGEWYIVTDQDSGWALAVWEYDTTGWSVWIPMDEKVLATVVDRTNPQISSDVWLVSESPTEAYSSSTMQLAWETSPGEWYHVLQHDNNWALAVYETDPPENTVWIPLDGRVQLTPGDAPHSPS